MDTRLSLGRLLLGVPLLLSLTACSLFGGGEPRDELETRRDALQIPPDLTAVESADTFAVPTLEGRVSARAAERGDVGSTGPDASTGGPAVLPPVSGIELRSDGSLRWLYVPETPEALWPRLRSFWGTYEISLTADEPRVGVMETDWKQDPLELDDGLISRIFAGIADSGLRDRFRLRLERSPDGQGTLVFLSHRGAEQVGIADSSGNVTGFVWQPRASDPQLEAEMLARLQQHLGGEPAVSDEGVVVAGSAYAVQSEAEGEPVLILNDSFERAWRRVGVTLDRIGLLVDEQARSDGIYYVTYNPAITREPQGFFAGLFDFRPGDELDEGVRFQVHLDEFDGGVRLKVRNAQGEVPERERALVVLGRLQAEFP